MEEAGIPGLQGVLKRPSVKKHVGAVHVAGKLTLLQRKLANVLLLNAYDALTTRRSHSIDARTLALMVGYNSNDVATLKAALRGLVETLVEWDMLDPQGTSEWGVSSFLAHARLKRGVCEYAYSPALAEKLADPKVFALINLDIQRRFASGHALALYENCYRFVRVRSTGWWPLETFRRLMGVDGSSYYETFKHLNAKIIKPAVAEVNRTSNITLTPELRRKGRTVTDIRFAIAENRQAVAFDLGDASLKAGRVYSRLVGQGIGDRLARQWIAEHGEEEVERMLDHVAGQRDVRSPAAYLSAAMAGGWRAPESKAPEPVAPDPTVAERAASWTARREADEAREAERRAERAEAGAARRRRFEAVEALVAARTPVQRDADRRLFLETLQDEVSRVDFRRHGWRSVLNAEAIFDFWSELEPDALRAEPAPSRAG
jgi:hypothetical protein